MYKQEKKLVGIDSKKDRILTFCKAFHNTTTVTTIQPIPHQDTRIQTLLSGGGSRGQKNV